MPQTQVIGRELADWETNRRNTILEKQKMIQDAAGKKDLLNHYANELKVKMKLSQDEVERSKLAQQVEYAKLGAKLFEDASKSSNPQEYLKTYQKMYPNVLPDLMKGGFQDALSRLEPSAETKLKSAEAEMLNVARSEMLRGGSAGGGMFGAGSGQGNGQQGNVIWEEFSAGPMKFVNLAAVRAKATAATLGKPLTLDESRVVAASGTISSAVNNLVRMVDEGVLDSLVTQSLVDWGRPEATMLLDEDIRDAVVVMNNLKNLIPFARGGKQLTPFEAKLVFRLIDTKGKTRKQIKRDLMVYKKEFETMVRGITSARGDLMWDKVEDATFGGGKDYKELVEEHKDEPVPTSKIKVGNYEISY